jgi:hypothetical protein
MSENTWFLASVARVTTATAVGWCLLVVVGLALHGPSAGPIARIFILVAAVLVPFAFGAWWMFRKLSTRYGRGLARSVTTVFVICTPIFLGAAMPLGQLTGAYAEAWFGPRFAVLGAFSGVILITIGLSFIACIVARSVTRHEMQITER